MTVSTAFNGIGVSNAHFGDSWVDVKGNDYDLIGNTGTGPVGDIDGYQTHQQLAAWGYGNIWKNNTSKLRFSAGFAINVTNQDGCKAT